MYCEFFHVNQYIEYEKLSSGVYYLRPWNKKQFMDIFLRYINTLFCSGGSHIHI
jgi:hypothetical protein